MAATVEEMSTQLSRFSGILKAFAASTDTFRPIKSSAVGSSTPCSHLHVLDSSFNPPTRAHLSLLSRSGTSPTTRVLLLLATQNADKPPAPASFEDRLAMMHLFAASVPLQVDIAITKHARFLDKAAELERVYPGAEQTYLTGYDTLIRLLDTKYYPPNHTLQPLESFFNLNRVVCTMRSGGGWGDIVEQREYVAGIGRGEREAEGCKKDWAERIELVEAAPESLGVSSTKVREAVKKGDMEALERYLTKDVKEWVLQRGLYATEA
ncbi:cytidylyltransferase [Sphaerosporella brunnea]|uniref:Cytidylyltransferase n=1 Tax=Sphaerosporella brunnea TaxID=1250544 RepID=A0A5J5EU56_9PEZI|nr:cytidylyltransferase [Sphaerosporella brunnea]